ncbi:MAG: NUDIX hydrolase [Bacteroidales bacterium]|jgi:ADP-ribose pyrophosphatase|nr:NUDIX hydrolase [Bacteroidales bacterium]
MNTADKKMYWEVLKSEYLFTEPWLTVRRDTVKLPNGHRIPSYYVVEYPDWINVIAITKSKRLVFVKQYRHGIGSVHFELCAGVCEKEDASPLISAQRELMEETGYGNGIWEEYMNLSPNASTMKNVTYCFLAKDVEKIGEPHLEDTEDLSVHLFSCKEVRKMLENNEIKQSLMAAPLWKFMAENREWN